MANMKVRHVHKDGLPGRIVCILGVLALSLAPCLAQSNICSDARTCGECIVLDPSCGWCTQGDYKDAEGKSRPRCDLITNFEQNGCMEISNPTSSFNKTQDEPLSNAGGVAAVQVKPQAVHLKLRPGLPVDLTMQVRQAEDYPVDLYYVMDLSKSMEDDLNNLKELGSVLAREMKAITSDFHLGFGSFVDKTVMPYVSTVPSKLIHPCTGCEAPYGFKNVLPLNRDTDLFTNIVRAQNASGNLDAPEGGLDALMQVTVCTSEIGWRDQARHLVIFTTDAPFHYAGDGKLGGIVTPNDGNCYLSTSGEYTKSTILDYPSIGQLNAKMQKNSVIPIFAVTDSKIGIYRNLTQYIEAATAGILAADSGNVVELVKDNYKKITSKVEVVDNAPTNITVAYTAHCLNGQVTPGSRECSDLKLGNTVNFTLSITATTCPEERVKTFNVRPIGFSEELTVTVEVVCDCDCEAQKVINSDKCSMGNGTLECGTCKCNPGRYGQDCECSSDDADLGDNDSSCRAGNSSIVCSGRGSCVCGLCVCFQRPNPSEQVSGKHCECDNFSCDRYKGELCGGPDRGVCVCDDKTKRSKCNCRPGYKGDACECSTRTDTCTASNGLICNGVGTCNCGKCECNVSTAYRGERCEECPACPGKCEVNEDCVECKQFGRGLSQEQCDGCPYPVIPVDELPTDENSERCLYHNEDGCSVLFTYQTLQNRSFILIVQKEPVCPVPVKVEFIIIGIVVGIIIIGLILLLIWRLLTYIHDTREFARFEKDRAQAKWDQSENPIYKPSTSTYKNPLYGK
ncbi:integrin beta-1-B-like [Acanthaster planci]|uniref:Integrin beta n=1 Tax=Acanthaster planci TaxID=133434 RepID=A0A8B7XI35_ACAPL|nr:integrin beta-1-B-like [Acanthaster planci]XP_022079782.1 integrin beta-1-B-like [Acanthaster planci]